ncbi:MAG TPA: hypothetical protein VKT78_03475, partial [Fimbriimonadaceae bacterium]|nr:hypothetical protein [Fimbriimonadaceae bacterium]
MRSNVRLVLLAFAVVITTGFALAYITSAPAKTKAPAGAKKQAGKKKAKQAAPKGPKLTPLSEDQLAAEDKACNDALARLDKLATALKSALAAGKSAKSVKDFVAPVDAAVKAYYDSVGNTTDDRHVTVADAAAAKAVDDAATTFAVGIKATPLVAAMHPTYKKDQAAAAKRLKAFTSKQGESALRGQLTSAGFAIDTKALQDAVKKFSPDDFTTTVSGNHNIDTLGGAGKFTDFVTKWCSSSSDYDAAIKNAGEDKKLLGNYFQDGATWPASAKKDVDAFDAAVGDKTVQDQGTRIQDRIYDVMTAAADMAFDAGTLALSIDETTTVRSGRIDARRAALGTLKDPLNKCKDSKALPAKTLASLVISLGKELDRCQAGLDLVTARSANLGGSAINQTINLYYFTSVPEVMRALNPDSQLKNDPFFTDKDISGQENQLRDATTKHLESVTAEQTAILGLKKADADLRKAQQDVQTKQNTVDKLQARINAANGSITASQRIAAQITAQQTALTALQSQYAQLSAQKDPPADPELLKSMSGQITRGQARLASLTQAQADQAGASAQQEAQMTEANKELTAAQGALTTAQNTYTTQKSQYDAATTATNNAQAGQFAASLAMGTAALQELKAFRDQQRHEPYWFSTPSVTSADPLLRCYIMGFENSNQLYVRGAPDDVNYVKELVGQFDTPSPQARITLYNLQVNSDRPADASRVVSAIQTELNTLRGNMMLVQDVLRNCIVQEVERVQRVNQSLLASPRTGPENDAVWRYFYYPDSVRKQLGIGDAELVFKLIDDSRQPDADLFETRYPGRRYAETVSSICDDLTQAKSKLEAAFLENANVRSFAIAAHAKGAKNKLAADQAEQLARAKRAADLTDAGWLAFRALSTVMNEEIGLTSIDNADPNLKALMGWSICVQQLVRNNAQNDDLLTKLCTPGYKLVDLKADMKTVGLDRFTLPSGESVSVASLAPTVTLGQAVMAVSDGYSSLQRSVAGTLTPSPRALAVGPLVVPDPVRCTTLGEMLMILSLGNVESRTRILHNFSNGLFDAVVSAQGESTQSDVSTFAKCLESIFGSTAETVLGNKFQSGNEMFPYFPRAIFGTLKQAVGESTVDGITANQAEIVSALRIQGQRNCIDSVLNDLSARNVPVRSNPSQKVMMVAAPDNAD